MTKPIQTRSHKTRARLIDTARTLVDAQGLQALRVDEVVSRAGVAKGTFFAHFNDKDGLLAHLIGERLEQALDRMESTTPPATVADLLPALAPLVETLTADRIVFDIAMRYSGGMGPMGDARIAQTTERQVHLCAGWIARAAAAGTMRDDQPPGLLAEGVQAFIAQTVALHFCEDTQAAPMDQLAPYLRAWLEVR